MTISQAADPSAGPFDVVAWPEKLSGRVVEAGADPAIHGYSVATDLSVHYGFVATVYLALVGELPSDDAARALDVALTFLSPVPINEAPAHAAAVTNLCGAPPRSVVATAAIALSERASAVVARHSAFLEWLREPSAAPPEEFLSVSSEEAEQRAHLAAALPASIRPKVLAHPLSRDASLVAVLFACGLQKPAHIEALWTLAGLATSFAEGVGLPSLAFLRYPMNLPAFVYKEAP